MSDKNTQSSDVTLVGGGMVGASLACVLGKLGIHTTVLEAFAMPEASHPNPVVQPSFDDRTVALSYGSRLLLENMGLWGAIGEHVEPIQSIQISEQKRLGLMRINAKEEGVDALGYVIENHNLGKALHAQLAPLIERGTVTWCAPAKVTHAETGYNTARVEYTLNEHTHSIDSQLLIAADGTQSFTRERLGITTHTTDYGLSAIVCNVQTQLAHNGRAFERFTPHGPLAVLPLKPFEGKPRVSLVITVRHEDVPTWQAYSDDEFLTEMHKQFGHRLGRLEKVGKRVVYPVSLMQADTVHTKRALVIGNAAQSLNPVAGQGFNLALRDLANVIELLTQQQASDAPIIDFGDNALTQAYAQARKKDRTATIEFTDGLIKLFSNDFLPLAHARAGGLLLTDAIEPMRQTVVKRGMGLLGKHRIKGLHL